MRVIAVNFYGYIVGKEKTGERNESKRKYFEKNSEKLIRVAVHISPHFKLFKILFPDLSRYTEYLTGTIPGLAFSILAFYMELEYMRTGKLAYGIIAAASISFAIFSFAASFVFS